MKVIPFKKKQDDYSIIHKQPIHGGEKLFIVYREQGHICFAICTEEIDCYEADEWVSIGENEMLETLYYNAFAGYIKALKDNPPSVNSTK